MQESTHHSMSDTEVNNLIKYKVVMRGVTNYSFRLQDIEWAHVLGKNDLTQYTLSVALDFKICRWADSCITTSSFIIH